MSDLLSKSKDGTAYSKKYDGRVEDSAFLYDSLDQLERNFESVYGDRPNKLEMEQALMFTRLFLSEIAETAPNTAYCRSAILINSLIDESVIKTAMELASIR